MIVSIGPIIAVVFLGLIASATGLIPIKKLIVIREAKHELKHGSPGFFRSISGWLVIVVWMTVVWFFATIIGDWWVTNDLEGAISRSARRLELIFKIISALADD